MAGCTGPFERRGKHLYHINFQCSTYSSLFDITQMLSPKSSARPMSPAKSARTQYPPLPESTMSPTQRTLSPNGHYERERRHTKTPSIAPSESASQIPRARSSNSKREKEPSVKPTRSEVEGRNSSGGSRGERSRADREYMLGRAFKLN